MINRESQPLSFNDLVKREAAEIARHPAGQNVPPHFLEEISCLTDPDRNLDPYDDLHIYQSFLVSLRQGVVLVFRPSDNGIVGSRDHFGKADEILPWDGATGEVTTTRGESVETYFNGY